MSSRVLVIDQGGQSTRACVVSAAGVVERSARRSVATQRAAGRVEHDANEVVLSVLDCVDELLSDSSAPDSSPSEIAGVGLATQRSSLLAWDRDTLQPLTPILSWQDCRGSEALSKLELDVAQIRTTTGLHPSPHYGASKYSWLQKLDDRVIDAGNRGVLRMGPISSYLTARLTDERTSYVDHTNAQRTLLWNVALRDWDADLLRLFDVSRESLPPCGPCLGPLGWVKRSGRAIPLLAVTGDQSAALYANGTPDPEVAYLNLGTGAFLQRMHANRAPAGLLTSVSALPSDGRSSVWEGAINGAGAALAVESERLGIDAMESRLDTALRNLDEEPPLFLNGVAGLGSPYWDASFQSEYLVDDKSSPMARLIAVAESIVFAVAVNLELMELHGGAVESVEATGGLARSEPLLARLATLIDRPVVRRTNPEATARGLAFLTTVATESSEEESIDTATEGAWIANDREQITACACPGIQDRYRRWRNAVESRIR